LDHIYFTPSGSSGACPAVTHPCWYSFVDGNCSTQGKEFLNWVSSYSRIFGINGVNEPGRFIAFLELKEWRVDCNEKRLLPF
jgi:hypothetical protein